MFLVAIRNVAKAQGGMKALSDATLLNRESLNHMLSVRGNPRFASIAAVLDKLGMKLTFKPKLQGCKAA